MDAEYIEKSINNADKLINKYILHSRRFIQYTCFPYGYTRLHAIGKIDISYVWDFEYFVFTKSTKSLVGIRTLLKQNNNEDVLILLRSIFENYLASRYFSEKVEEDDMKHIQDFVFIPHFLSNRIYYHDGENTVKTRGGKAIDYTQLQPSELRLGKDKKYFHDLYGFLCEYVHCNFGTIGNYMEENQYYTADKNDNPLLTRVLTIFVYTKLFESIVTVEGEDFINETAEKNCYNLVKDANIFLHDVLDNLTKHEIIANKYYLKHIKSMFKNMKKSLTEEIGSLNKDFLK